MLIRTYSRSFLCKMGYRRIIHSSTQCVCDPGLGAEGSVDEGGGGWQRPVTEDIALAHAHTYARTHAHARTHTHTHTHAHVLSRPLNFTLGIGTLSTHALIRLHAQTLCYLSFKFINNIWVFAELTLRPGVPSIQVCAWSSGRLKCLYICSMLSCTYARVCVRAPGCLSPPSLLDAPSHLCVCVSHFNAIAAPVPLGHHRWRSKLQS